MDVIFAVVVGNLKVASVDEHEPIELNNGVAVVVTTIAPLLAAAPVSVDEPETKSVILLTA